MPAARYKSKFKVVLYYKIPNVTIAQYKPKFTPTFSNKYKISAHIYNSISAHSLTKMCSEQMCFAQMGWLQIERKTSTCWCCKPFFMDKNNFSYVTCVMQHNLKTSQLELLLKLETSEGRVHPNLLLLIFVMHRDQRFPNVLMWTEISQDLGHRPSGAIGCTCEVLPQLTAVSWLQSVSGETM